MGQSVTWQFYVLELGKLVGYVDMRSGEVVKARVPINNVRSVIPGGDGRVFLVIDGALHSIDRLLTQPPKKLADVGYVAATGAKPGHVWWFTYNTNSGPGLTLTHFDINGAKAASASLPSGSEFVGSLGDGFLSSAGGRIYLHNPASNTVKEYGVGQPGLSHGSTLVWQTCDAALACKWQVGDQTNPTRLTLPVTSPYAFTQHRGSESGPIDDQDVRLAPTGLFVALQDSDALKLIPLDGRSPLSMPNARMYMSGWSPDGNWLFINDSSTVASGAANQENLRKIRAVETASMNWIELTFPPATEWRGQFVQLVAGVRMPRPAGVQRFQTRDALPLTTSSRSCAETPSNILSTVACEVGQLETGCG